jgi:gluconolactonase
VWSPGAKLLGKIKVRGGVANFCFGRRGELFLLNETRFYVVRVSETVHGALLANMKIDV